MVKDDSFLVASINTNITNYRKISNDGGAAMLVLELWQVFTIWASTSSSSSSVSLMRSPSTACNSKRSRRFSPPFYEVVNVCSTF